MRSAKKRVDREDLQAIPGVGPAMARDLVALGYTTVSSLKGADPEAMYRELCRLRGHTVDRCVLYVFRCAVYFAGPEPHDLRRLKWWNWKDGGRR